MKSILLALLLHVDVPRFVPSNDLKTAPPQARTNARHVWINLHSVIYNTGDIETTKSLLSKWRNTNSSYRASWCGILGNHTFYESEPIMHFFSWILKIWFAIYQNWILFKPLKAALSHLVKEIWKKETLRNQRAWVYWTSKTLLAIAVCRNEGGAYVQRDEIRIGTCLAFLLCDLFMAKGHLLSMPYVNEMHVIARSRYVDNFLLSVPYKTATSINTKNILQNFTNVFLC